MGFVYVPISPEFRETMNRIFTDEFMQKNTNFENFTDFQSSSAVFVNWKFEIMVYNTEVFDGFVKESTRFETWDDMVKAAIDDYNN